MENYQPVDALYEDIYNFDDLLEKKKTPPRPGRTYSLDENGNRVRPLNRHKLADKSPVRLPPVAAGYHSASSTHVVRPAASVSGNHGSKAVTINHRTRVVDHTDIQGRRAEQNTREVDWDKERQKLYGQRHFKREVGATKAQLTDDKHHVPNTDTTDWSRDCELLIKSGDFDPSNDPRVQAYERQNRNAAFKHKSEACVATNGYDVIPAISGGKDVFYDERIRKYEESIQPRCKVLVNSTENKNIFSTTAAVKEAIQQTPDLYSENILLHEVRPKTGFKPGSISENNTHYLPTPPTAPRPDGKPPLPPHRRRPHQYSCALDQNVSIHNPAVSLNRSSGPYYEKVEIEHEREFREAIEMQKRLDEYHEQLSRQTNPNDVIEVMRPNTAILANMNVHGRGSPCLIPTGAIPTKTVEPVKQWNGYTAKRGLGFKSKIKKEVTAPKRVDTVIIPEKIRKQMDKYFP